MRPHGSPAAGFGKESLRLTAAAFVTAGVSAVTVKLIAVNAGPMGMGLFSVFRYLASLLSWAFGLGFANILTRQMASARNEQMALEAFQASLALTAAQAVAFFFLGLLGPALIARVFFSGNAEIGILTIRIIIFMAFLNLALQNSLAVLRADLDTTALSLVNLATAAASLMLIIPLLKLGTVGLAVNVGSGAVVGLGATLFILFSRHPAARNTLFLRMERFKLLLGRSIDSLALAGSQVVSDLALLWVTARVAGFSMRDAGQFGAAMLVADTFGQIVFASARTTALARLARATDAQAEAKALSYTSETLVAAAGGAAGLLVCVAPATVLLLYSRDFSRAPILLSILAAAFPLEAFAWTANAAQTARGHFRLSAAYGAAYPIFLFALTALASATFGLDSLTAAIAMATAKGLGASVLALEHKTLPMRTLGRAIVTTAFLGLSVWLIHTGRPLLGIPAAILVSGFCAAPIIKELRARAPGARA